jgi:uncharacterized protein
MKNSKMKKIFLFVAAFSILLSMAAVPSIKALAKTSGDIQHIYDKAGLLSESDLNSLEDMCAEYSEKDDLDIIILTHNDSSAVDAEVYIENFVDKMQYLDSVVLLVDMNSRDVCLESYGKIKSHITASRGDAIINEITPSMQNADYADAFAQYIKSSDKYMNYIPLYLNPLIQLAVAFIIGGIAVAVMAYNSGGKMTVNGNNYISSNDSGLIGKRDDYIRTQVTRIRKPQNNSGGGGISAGGLSHTTSRGKF